MSTPYFPLQVIEKIGTIQLYRAEAKSRGVFSAKFG
jgi:hypothetical protein